MQSNRKEKDQLIWKGIKSGDSEAFFLVYDQYVDILINSGSYYSSDKEFVKNCIHDLFLDLYKYRKNLSENDNIKLYLIKSLKRKIFKEIRKNSTLKLVDDFDNPSAESENAEELLISKEREDGIEKVIRFAMSQLPEKQREAVQLKFILELSYEEIAILMDISIESVRTNIYRAIKTLREKLDVKHKSILYFWVFMKKKRMT